MKRKVPIIVAVSAAVIAALFAVFVSCATLEIYGTENVTVRPGETYTDEGVCAKSLFIDLTGLVTVETLETETVDGNPSAIYRYFLSLPLKKLLAERTVVYLKDSTPPVVTLNGDENTEIYAGEEFVDPLAEAFDDVDGDIKDRLTVTTDLDVDVPGEYTVTYTAADSSGNSSSVVRRVTVLKKAVNPEEVFAGETRNETLELFLDKNYPDVSVGYYNLSNGKCWFYNPDKSHYGASLIKTVDALYLYENGLVDGEIYPYLEQAIRVSDNASHSYLLRFIEREKFNGYLLSLGVKNLLPEGRNYTYTNAREQILIFKRLYELSKDNPEITDLFVNNYANKLKFGDHTIMHKHGLYEPYYHDTGIFFEEEEPYIITVLTERGNNGAYAYITQLISRAVYDEHVKGF